MQHDRKMKSATRRPASSHVRYLAAAWLLAAAGAAGAQPTPPAIELSNGREKVSALFIGSHLAAGLAGGEPGAAYRFELRNAGNVLIATADTEADLAGNVPAVGLWAHTGVVGCDLGAVADPSLYRFTSFTDAEDALGGTSLQLLALDLEVGVAVAARTVPILAVPQELPYFSDAAGCFRSHYPSDEDVYVSFFHPERAVAERALFLVSQPAAGIQIGDPIFDVRSMKAPQYFNVEDAGNPVTVKIWSSALTSPGSFALISRDGEGEAAPVTFVQAADDIVEVISGISTTGLNVGVNGCNCIVPPGP